MIQPICKLQFGDIITQAEFEPKDIRWKSKVLAVDGVDLYVETEADGLPTRRERWNLNETLDGIRDGTFVLTKGEL